MKKGGITFFAAPPVLRHCVPQVVPAKNGDPAFRQRRAPDACVRRTERHARLLARLRDNHERAHVFQYLLECMNVGRIAAVAIVDEMWVRRRCSRSARQLRRERPPKNTWASWLRQSDALHLGAADLAGWKSESMVRCYAHVSVKHLQPCANQLTFVLKIREGGEAQKTAEADGAKSPTARARAC